MWSTRVSIGNPVFATMMMLAFVVLGAFSYQRLSIDQFPNIDVPTVVVQIDYPGASPEIVEAEVTRKVEEEWLPQLEASKAAGVPFRLAECNTASGGGKRGVSDAFASALWALDFLFDVAEHGGAGVNLHGGFTPGNYSPICYLRKEQRFEPSPIYYGMLLFHEAARGRVIEAERDTEGRLAVHATLGDDQRLRVVLINKDLTTPITASINAASMGAGAQLIRLSAPSPDSTTGVTLAGSAVAPDGTWKPQPSELLPCKDGRCEVTLPSASAALLTIDPR
jgi:hypothetical protein